MPKNTLRSFFLYVCPLIVFTVLLNAGCLSKQGTVSHVKSLPIRAGKIVVFGFRPAMPKGYEPGVMRSPVSGAVFMAEPVPLDVTNRMTDSLFSRLLEYERYELVDSDQARGVFSSLVESNQGMNDMDIVQKIGQAFSADGVMIGYIYRWQEREGSDYSVHRPASAAFDLYLIRPDDRAILWKGRFDKTQVSLSENILDVGAFIKGKGLWMTVDELAELGLNELLDRTHKGGKVERKD